MDNNIYVITGATGNVGKEVANQLFATGKQIRVIGRSLDRLKEFTDKGIQAFVGELEDASFLIEAFKGAKAALTMIPPEPKAKDFRGYQKAVGKALFEAISSSNVQFVVNISSVGAHLPQGTGPIIGHYENEQKLNQIETANIVHLRTTYFMENLLPNVWLMNKKSINTTPMLADFPFAIVATKDIASISIKLLQELSFTGKSVLELLGPRDVTMTEITSVFANAIKKPLKYLQLSYENAKQMMINGGMSESAAELMVEMYQAFNNGILKPTQERSDRNCTPTSIEEFSNIVAQAYNQIKS